MNTLYQNAKEIILKLKKKGYFDEFNQVEMFYLDFENEGKKMLLIFIQSFFGASYGIQILNNNNGFEYMHKIGTSENPDSITIGDCDSIFAIIKSKADLIDKDYKYLKDNHVRVKDYDNVIFYRYQTGFEERYCNDNEVGDFILASSFMQSFLKNDYQDIKECFNNGYTAMAYIDTDKLSYNARYQDLPYLVPEKRKLKENKEFIEEFKNFKYIDDSIDFYTTYLPIKISENKRRVLLILIHYNKYGYNDIFYIKDKTTVKSAIMGMLYESFMKHGIPLEANFCHYEYKLYIEKTLDKLNVEVKSLAVSDETQDIAQQISDNIFSISNDETLPYEDVSNILTDAKNKVISRNDNNNEKNNINNDFGFVS